MKERSFFYSDYKAEPHMVSRSGNIINYQLDNTCELVFYVMRSRYQSFSVAWHGPRLQI